VPIEPASIAVSSQPYDSLLLSYRNGEEIVDTRRVKAQAFIVLTGALAIEAGDERWLVPKGYTAWIPPHYPLRELYYGSVDLVGLYLAPLHCSGPMSAPAVLRTSSMLAVLLRRLATEPLRQETKARRQRMFAVLLDELAAADRQSLTLPSPRDPRLLGIVRALMDQPGDRRNTEELARDFALSRRTLARLFREETAITFETWRLRRRVIAAIELLASGKSVTHVSSDLGYDSLSAFIRTFRKLMGMSPGAWLKKQCDLQSRYGGLDGLVS
jgi:AraC-like DNA-binding protein